ncbi:prepilin peptidase-dependent protein [Enterobacteriaceae bacterium 4M9]|nr:prepilin peptidase-dependent protein [Enterobacteriaceae bacterium 4M9]
MPVMHGFTLPEALLAVAIGSMVLLAGSRLLPVLQLATLREAQVQNLEAELWRQVFTVGKTLQRAGYCRSECTLEGLRLLDSGRCVIVSRELAPGTGTEQVGFRLRGGALETFSGSVNCESGGWERMTDPASLRVEQFQVQRESRGVFAPRLTITLRAQALNAGARVQQLVHSVSGFNL